MEEKYTDEEVFSKLDYTKKGLAKGEYEKCTFSDCDFSNSDVSGILFTSCLFLRCNLSLAKLSKTGFQDVRFKDCKMLGLHFEHCNQFGIEVSFETCMLNHCLFYQVKIAKTKFVNSSLHEVDFTECDLTESLFDNCDLSGSTFENTIAIKADFRTSYNYSINPQLNRIKKAKFSLSGLPGLLESYDIEIGH